MSKEKDLLFIKNFSKITISSICKDLNINNSNIWNGNASEDTTRKVREEIENRYKKIQKK